MEKRGRGDVGRGREAPKRFADGFHRKEEDPRSHEENEQLDGPKSRVACTWQVDRGVGPILMPIPQRWPRRPHGPRLTRLMGYGLWPIHNGRGLVASSLCPTKRRRRGLSSTRRRGGGRHDPPSPAGYGDRRPATGILARLADSGRPGEPRVSLLLCRTSEQESLTSLELVN